MSAILYMIRKSIKNSLIELFHHPSKLIAYLFIFVFLGISIFSTGSKQVKTAGLNINILHGLYFALLMFILIASIMSALKSGTTFFTMSDVNFLFISPISPRKILVYGLTKQMVTTFFALIFILFYAPMLMNNFNITWNGFFIIFLGLAVLSFTAQLVALIIYSFSNGKTKITQAVKNVTYLLIVGTAVIMGQSFLANGSGKEAAFQAIASPYLEWIPIAGWIKGAVFQTIAGQYTQAMIFGLLTIVTIIVGLFVFVKSNPDYFEDVLQNTESTYELKKAIKDGNNATIASMKNKKVKVRDMGLNKGWGASTFFYKHICEAKRRSRFSFVSVSTLVITGIIVAVPLIAGKIAESDHDTISKGLQMAIALGFGVYIQFFMNAAGDWVKELMRPYIYLVPEKPFKLLIWSSMTTIIKPMIDGTIAFTVLCIVLQGNPLTALICILIYGGFGFLFTASNVLSERLFGSLASKGLLIILYMFALMILIAPGVIGSIFLMTSFSWLPEIIIGLPIAVWNILVSVIIFVSCKNILATAELKSL